MPEPMSMTGYLSLHRPSSAASHANRLASALRQIVLSAVRAAGPDGITTSELCARHPLLDPRSLRARFTELRNMGAIRAAEPQRTNDAGTSEIVWLPVADH